MPIQRFTDTEYAIIVDCLSSARDQMHSQGHETPNIESALAKFHSWATPAGCEFIAVTGDEARAFDPPQLNPGGLTVFGWVGSRHGRQTREIVAAPTRTAAIRLSGLTVGEARHSMSETRVAQEVAIALSDAGVVFWRDLYARDYPFVKATP